MGKYGRRTEKKNQFTYMEHATAMTATVAATNNCCLLSFPYTLLIIKCISISIESKSMSNALTWHNYEQKNTFRP